MAQDKALDKAKIKDKARDYVTQARVSPGQSGSHASKRRKVHIANCPSCNKPLINEQVHDGETGGQYVVCPNTFDVIFINYE